MTNLKSSHPTTALPGEVISDVFAEHSGHSLKLLSPTYINHADHLVLTIPYVSKYSPDYEDELGEMTLYYSRQNPHEIAKFFQDYSDYHFLMLYSQLTREPYELLTHYSQVKKPIQPLPTATFLEPIFLRFLDLADIGAYQYYFDAKEPSVGYIDAQGLRYEASIELKPECERASRLLQEKALPMNKAHSRVDTERFRIEADIILNRMELEVSMNHKTAHTVSSFKL